MTFPSRFFPRFLAGIVLLLGATAANAIPKAAEHEDAPVIIAPDVAKPAKASAKPVKKTVHKKATPAAKTKPGKPAATAKKNKAAKAAGRK